MNTLLENEIITELPCGINFAYVLNDSSEFLMTDYKVLQSQSNGGFIKCMKMHINGKVALYYLVDNFKTFSSMLSLMSIENFMTIVANLFNEIIEVKNNGFLTCQNIDISFEKIYVDTNTLKVHLVYVPVKTKAFDDYAAFENALRTSLVKLINTLSSLSKEESMEFAIDLSNGMYSIEDLYNRIKSIKGTGIKVKPIVCNEKLRRKSMHLVSMNAPMRVEIFIDKDDYVLGKNPSMVDGAITFNKAISRMHCKVSNNAGQYMITDLGSANGTYVNKVKLLPNEPHPINNGDVLRLANSDFQIIVG